ncbi:hypothetical protein T484DRAFT_1759854, partial [Baffinella frigidus]
MPPSSSKVEEPADFDPTVNDLEPWLEGFNSWMSQANPSCAYIGFSPLAGIRTPAVTAEAHEYMKNARTESLLNDRRYKKVGEPGEGPDNMAMVLLQKEIQFFIIICRKFKCWEQYFASVANYTTNCGTNAFLKIIEHSNGLPTLRIQLQLIKTLATPLQGDTASSYTVSCRAMMKLVAQVGPLDAATIGKIYIASSCILAMSGRPQQRVFGVGLAFEAAPDQVSLVVVGLEKGLSAQRSGLIEVGDEIVKVDGVVVEKAPMSLLRERVLGPQGSYVTLTFRRVSACNAFIFEVEMMRGAGDYLALSALVKKKERSLVSLAARSSQLEASEAAAKQKVQHTQVLAEEERLQKQMLHLNEQGQGEKEAREELLAKVAAQDIELQVQRFARTAADAALRQYQADSAAAGEQAEVAAQAQLESLLGITQSTEIQLRKAWEAHRVSEDAAEELRMKLAAAEAQGVELRAKVASESASREKAVDASPNHVSSESASREKAVSAFLAGEVDCRLLRES